MGCMCVVVEVHAHVQVSHVLKMIDQLKFIPALRTISDSIIYNRSIEPITIINVIHSVIIVVVQIF